MSKKLSTIWPATPHTKAKLEILKQYLNAWFRILGKTRRGQTILYVDGFAGPGTYTNHPEGSPLAAVRAAKSAIADLDANFVAREIHCAFIEKDPRRYEILSGALAEHEGYPRLGITHYRAEFVEGIELVRKNVPAPFSGQGPLLVFADPFGGTDIPFRVFADCMRGAASELLINLDADGIGRIFYAENPRREQQLTELFGDESWRAELRASDPLPQLSLKILALYKRRLLTLAGVKFIWSFAMRSGAADSINYHLVFASKHPLGLEKMKEAMKAIDQTGTYSFSDAHVDQHTLFREDNEAFYSNRMWQQFAGKRISYANIHLYALNETPFLNSKGMLRRLETAARIEVEVVAGAIRKKGDFSEGKIAAIAFGEFGSNLVQDEFPI